MGRYRPHQFDSKKAASRGSYERSTVSSDDGAATGVTYYPRTDALALDTAPSTTQTDGNARQSEVEPLSLVGDPLELRVFVDRSVVEVFANGRQSLTGRVYPALGSDGLAVRSRGGRAELVEGTVSPLRAAPFDGRDGASKPRSYTAGHKD